MNHHRMYSVLSLYLRHSDTTLRLHKFLPFIYLLIYLFKKLTAVRNMCKLQGKWQFDNWCQRCSLEPVEPVLTTVLMRL